MSSPPANHSLSCTAQQQSPSDGPGLARPGWALTAVGLVRLVLAVVVAVAAPAQVHALAAAAGELGLGAEGRPGRGRGLGGATAATQLGCLVRAVVAVQLAVADPALGDAGAVVAAAAKLSGPAGRLGAAPLVAAVAAVVVAVTHEHGGQARAVAALELMRGAHCSGQTARSVGRATRPCHPGGGPGTATLPAAAQKLTGCNLALVGGHEGGPGRRGSAMGWG